MRSDILIFFGDISSYVAALPERLILKLLEPPFVLCALFSCEWVADSRLCSAVLATFYSELFLLSNSSELAGGDPKF